jgi:hypothetical protein
MLRFISFFVIALAFSACLLERVPAAPAGKASPDPALAEALRRHVAELSVTIGARSYQTPMQLERAAAYVERELRAFEAPPTATARVLAFTLANDDGLSYFWCRSEACKLERGEDEAGARVGTIAFKNIELEVRGTLFPGEVVVVGGHYDSDTCRSGGCNPGADDNATGTAAVIELARRFQARPAARTVRFVGFANEELPFFHGDAMGSLVYARQGPKPGDKMIAMLSLETMGFYSDAADSQSVPLLLGSLYGLPTVGNFIAFVGDGDSGALVRESVGAFQKASAFPAEGIIAASWIPGVDWSDHWSFWQAGVPAVMVTDTAPNRNPCYHKPCDTIDALDFDRFAVVVTGLEGVVRTLASR